MKTLTGTRLWFESIIQKAALDMNNYADFSCIQLGEDTGENRPKTEREASSEITMPLPEQYLELVRVFKEAKRDFIYIFS
jgi:hypothetical protein